MGRQATRYGGWAVGQPIESLLIWWGLNLGPLAEALRAEGVAVHRQHIPDDAIHLSRAEGEFQQRKVVGQEAAGPFDCGVWELGGQFKVPLSGLRYVHYPHFMEWIDGGRA